MKKNIYVCICVTESLHCTPETNTLSINYALIIFLKGKNVSVEHVCVDLLLFLLFLDFSFNVDHFLKSLLNLLQYFFCFMFWFFGYEACGIFTPQPRIEPAPPTLGGGLNHWTTREVLSHFPFWSH